MFNKSSKYITVVKFLALAMIFILTASSCIFVKVKEKPVEEVFVDVIQKPEIEMNEDALRSTKGDMISLIPKNWFFVDLGENTPRDIFAIAVNPQYTLSVVFSTYPSNEVIDEIFKAQNLIGLSNYSFDKKQKKAMGGLIKEKRISTIKSGNLNFVVYNYRTKTQPIYSQTAVFKSSNGAIYEISLVPMNISGYSLPPEKDIETIFKSILATVRY
ncbi:MAG: hypothetical protein A2X64_10475 [Ignavibacteria bacterium GWF2_33_9]|nr:MAG: hypothetical protein A2X64_10475 [Ignavibacteria bacterium GWF2_33_9]